MSANLSFRKLALLIGVLATQPFCLFAKSISPLIQEGVNFLEKKDLQSALASFELATRADSKSGIAAFFHGVGLNRIGRGKEASSWFSKSQELGYFHKSLDFERGWAHLQMKSYQKASKFLEADLVVRPNNLQSLEFLGRCQYGLGQFQKAQSSFEEVLRQDESFQDTIKPFMALVKRRTNPGSKSPGLDRLIESSPPGSSIRKALITRISGSRRPKPSTKKTKKKRAEYFIRAAIGSSNNVIALPDSSPLPGDITSRSGNFLSYGLSARYRFDPDSKKTLTMAGYSYDKTDFRGDASVVDQHSHLLFGYWRNKLKKDKYLSVLVSDQISAIRSSTFLNRFAVRPTLSRKYSEKYASDLSLEFAKEDFKLPANSQTDRDSESLLLSWTGHFAMPKSSWKSSLTLSRGIIETDGADFDRDTRGIALALTRPIFREGSVRLIYSRRKERFDNLNSFSGFTSVRDDDVESKQMEWSWPILKQWKKADSHLFFRLGRTEVDSNVGAFSFDQTNVSLGYQAKF